MVSRKRGREEMEDETGVLQEEPSTLQKIRNMWEFASLMQYIFFFGKAVKIEEIEVEVCCRSIMAAPKVPRNVSIQWRVEDAVAHGYSFCPLVAHNAMSSTGSNTDRQRSC
jgi:hypothetical protein